MHNYQIGSRQMTDLIQTLQAIRDEYAHERNAWLSPPFGEAEKYALWCARAQTKVDALNEVIAILISQQSEAA
jgi:hypothetical protein